MKYFWSFFTVGIPLFILCSELQSREGPASGRDYKADCRLLAVLEKESLKKEVSRSYCIRTKESLTIKGELRIKESLVFVKSLSPLPPSHAYDK